MKKVLAVAAVLFAGTAAHAQYTFEYGGHTIRIDPDRGTISIPGVYDNTGRKPKRAKNEGMGTRKQKSQQQEAKTNSQTTPAPAQAPALAPVEQAAAPSAPASGPAPSPPATTSEPSSTTAAVGRSEAATAPPPASGVQQKAAPASPRSGPPPAPTVAAAPPAPKSMAAAIAPANSPIGVWQTEEKEGKVRIEQCGANLCGYAVDEKSDQNGEQILINMKPGKDKWSGRIFDPNTGSTYDSTIALRGPDSLRVQGCAFGGMFCGGQTWTRLN
jgi:uncharacterized protein (DUF2147 family)